MWRLRWKIENLLAPLGLHFRTYDKWFCLGRWKKDRDYAGGTIFKCPKCDGAWWRLSR